MTEAKWSKTTLIHIAGALRNRWICSTCGGVRCEILLTLNAEPEMCLKEGLDVEHNNGQVQYVRTYQADGDVDLFI